MVDQIMDLSTTYSMIPGEIKESKKKKTASRDQEILSPDYPNMSTMGRKMIKMDEIPHGSTSKYLELRERVPFQGEQDLAGNSSKDNTGKRVRLGFNARKE